MADKRYGHLGWQRVCPIYWDTEPGRTGVPSMYPFLNEGDDVRVRTARFGPWRSGKVKMLWLGLEEAIDVEFEDGERKTFYPSMDDELQMRVS